MENNVNNGLISEGPIPKKTNQNNQIINNGLISEGPAQKYTPTTKEEYKPQRYIPKYNNDGTISKGTSLEIPTIKNNEREKNNQNNIKPTNKTINKAINKSINKTEIKKKEKKGRKINISKKIIIGSIAIIMMISHSQKINIHTQTEFLKNELLQTISISLTEDGHNLENINLEEIINNYNKEYLKENLFKFYLLIKENTNYKNENYYYDLLIQKAELDDSFEEYLKNQGFKFFYTYTPGGKAGTEIADREYWENTMEANELKKKKIELINEGKINPLENQVEEIAKQIKGAR